MAYFSERIISTWQKAKEKSREFGMNSMTYVNPEVKSKSSELTPNVSSKNNGNILIESESAKPINSCVKYSEPFETNLNCSAIQVSHSNFIDFKISKSSCSLSTASVSLSQPKIENFSFSHPVLKNENVNLFNNVSSLDDGPANILISSSTNTDSNSTPTDISLQSNNLVLMHEIFLIVVKKFCLPILRSLSHLLEFKLMVIIVIFQVVVFLQCSHHNQLFQV